jgi:hypothetical protein
MNKHQQNYLRIEKFKERFRKLSSEAIRHRLAGVSLVKEAEIAYREVLEERGEQIHVYKQDFQSAKGYKGLHNSEA